MRPWDKHPPWAHWAFYLVWGVAGTLGPFLVAIWLIGKIMSQREPAAQLWLGLVLCGVWIATLALDWLAVRWLRAHVDGWAPWTPPNWRWLRR